MNKELIEALEILEKEKNISKATMLEAIENSLLTACKNHFGKADNVKVNINPTTGDFAVLASKEVVGRAAVTGKVSDARKTIKGCIYAYSHDQQPLRCTKRRAALCAKPAAESGYN